MRPSERLKEKLPEIRKIMEANEYFTNLRVFGSVASGTDTEDSVIDFLVTARKDCSYFDEIHLQNELETCLGMTIDLMVQVKAPLPNRDAVLNQMADILKKDYGMGYLIENQFNLSKAVKEYGEGWLRT